MIDIPNFDNWMDEVKFIQQNKTAILHKKKSAVKYAESVCFGLPTETIEKDFVNKSDEFKEVFKAMTKDEDDLIHRKVVINTTNLVDSHRDLHVNGLWNKSLKETKYIPFLQEHKMSFDSIISCSEKDGLKAYTKNFNWSDIGFNFKGNTEALVFDAPISNKRNPFMFDQYKKGYVRNHSVGMILIKVLFCVGNKDIATAEEFENWEKYYPMVANKDVLESRPYFWAVTEAKVREGSAVVMGSNYATPTLENKEEIENIEAVTDTSNTSEPTKVTQTRRRLHY